MLARFDAATARVIDDVRSYSPTTPVEGGMFEIDDLSPKAGGVHELMPRLVESPHAFEAREFGPVRQYVRHGVYSQLVRGGEPSGVTCESLRISEATQWHPEQRQFFESCISEWGLGELK
jgi:hypothetical protein